MADVLPEKPMLWNAVLAVRLAVLFCRARVDFVLPQGMTLSLHDKTFTLKMSQSWLDDNPLTASALVSESSEWNKIGRVFQVQAM